MSTTRKSRTANDYVCRLLVCCLFLLAGCEKDKVLHSIQYANDGDTKNSITYHTAEGGIVISKVSQTKAATPGAEAESNHFVCVAPPAQGVRLTDASFSTKGAAKLAEQGEVSAEVEYERDRAVEKLYTQSQGNLLLQFAMYRLCEMAMNGLISEFTYYAMFIEVLENANNIILTEQRILEEKNESAQIELKKQFASQALTHLGVLRDRMNVLSNKGALTDAEKASIRDTEKYISELMTALMSYFSPDEKDDNDLQMQKLYRQNALLNAIAKDSALDLPTEPNPKSK